MARIKFKTDIDYRILILLTTILFSFGWKSAILSSKVESNTTSIEAVENDLYKKKKEDTRKNKIMLEIQANLKNYLQTQGVVWTELED